MRVRAQEERQQARQAVQPRSTQSPEGDLSMNRDSDVGLQLADLEEEVGYCVHGGNIGGVACAAIRAAAKIITSLLK